MMRLSLLSVLLASCLLDDHSIRAFVPSLDAQSQRQQHQQQRHASVYSWSGLHASGSDNHDAPSQLLLRDSDPASGRRQFFVTSTTAVATASGLVSGWIAGRVDHHSLLLPLSSKPPSAWAVSGANKVNSRLLAYGLPPAAVPDGLTPLLEIYGKGKNRFPILVTFGYPITWVVTTPSNDVNGEDGTVQAGDYGKGDTATFFVYAEPGHVDQIASQPKELFERALIKSISQKGDNMYQNFKVTKLEPAAYQFGQQQYMLADFKYQLLTGAGFEVDRRGVAAITSTGNAVQVLWAASTTARFKKTEPLLRNIVTSFRCYADGLNLSAEDIRLPFVDDFA